MAEPKPLASLTSGLLARKGAASPAMRRPVFGLTAGATALQEDLGWNDMGFDVTQPEPAPTEARSVAGLTPMTAVPAVAPVPAVVTEREELAERIVETTAPAPVAKAKVEKPKKALKARPAAVAHGRKAAFTLRLDADRHLKLRLASAIVGRSAQQMVTEALDAYLSSLPDVDRLAQQLPRARGDD